MAVNLISPLSTCNAVSVHSAQPSASCTSNLAKICRHVLCFFACLLTTGTHDLLAFTIYAMDDQSRLYLSYHIPETLYLPDEVRQEGTCRSLNA